MPLDAEADFAEADFHALVMRAVWRVLNISYCKMTHCTTRLETVLPHLCLKCIKTLSIWVMLLIHVHNLELRLREPIGQHNTADQVCSLHSD